MQKLQQSAVEKSLPSQTLSKSGFTLQNQSVPKSKVSYPGVKSTGQSDKSESTVPSGKLQSGMIIPLELEQTPSNVFVPGNISPQGTMHIPPPWRNKKAFGVPTFGFTESASLEKPLYAYGRQSMPIHPSDIIENKLSDPGRKFKGDVVRPRGAVYFWDADTRMGGRALADTAGLNPSFHKKTYDKFRAGDISSTVSEDFNELFQIASHEASHLVQEQFGPEWKTEMQYYYPDAYKEGVNDLWDSTYSNNPESHKPLEFFAHNLFGRFRKISKMSNLSRQSNISGLESFSLSQFLAPTEIS